VGPRVVSAGAESARRVRWRRESVVREMSAMRGMLEVGLVGSGRDERRQWRSVIFGLGWVAGGGGGMGDVKRGWGDGGRGEVYIRCVYEL
jgi:hypothetical protein